MVVFLRERETNKQVQGIKFVFLGGSYGAGVDITLHFFLLDESHEQFRHFSATSACQKFFTSTEDSGIDITKLEDLFYSDLRALSLISSAQSSVLPQKRKASVQIASVTAKERVRGPPLAAKGETSTTEEAKKISLLSNQVLKLKSDNALYEQKIASLVEGQKFSEKKRKSEAVSAKSEIAGLEKKLKQTEGLYSESRLKYESLTRQTNLLKNDLALGIKSYNAVQSAAAVIYVTMCIIQMSYLLLGRKKRVRKVHGKTGP